MQSEYAQLKQLIANSRVIAFLGGAGVSTESGLPDFRGENVINDVKLRYGYTPEVILSHDFFLAETETFFAYYKAELLKPAAPNPAHYALAELEKRGKLNAVITQNIDNLHYMAGSRRIYPLHGSIEWNRCMDCNALYDADYIRNSAGVPRCGICGGIVKPEAVLYGEPLDEYIWRGAKACVAGAELLIVAGTSLNVFPAASLMEFYGGRHTVIISKEKTGRDEQADLCIHADVGEVLSAVISG